MSLHLHSISSLPRSPSRPSSRTSIRSARAASPASLNISLDDPVAVRNQVSTLKHSIRQQQAQLHNLENIILRGPRPLPPGFMSSPPLSPEPSDISLSSPPSSYSALSNLSTATSPPSSYASPTTKAQRRSSFDILQGLAGPDSNLPLPLPAKSRERDGRTTPTLNKDGIREGVPMEFGVGPVNGNAGKRVGSPTRTLSRIPVAAVGNARALAEDGASADISSSSLLPNIASTSYLQPPSPSLSASPSLLSTPSTSLSSKRASLTPGGTTKVLADLQLGVTNAKNALEHTRTQLRQSQRAVAQLTRQTEDLKEGRERLRLENEGLNGVVARKERLLQELLDRARKAESEATTYKAQLKSETLTSKKSLREMETALLASTTLSQKSEREYITLRDSLKSLGESWKIDMEGVRGEMRKREEALRKEAEDVGRKYRELVEELKREREGREKIKELEGKGEKIRNEVEQEFRDEIEQLRGKVEEFSMKSEKANENAKALAGELARLRRLMQSAGRSPQISFVEGGDEAPP